MNRMYMLGGLLAVAVAFSAVRAEEDKAKSIKEIMKEAHGGKGLKNLIKGAASKGDWDSASNAAKTWSSLAADLEKGKAPKGEASSWKDLTGSYTKVIKGVEEAVGKKDAKAVGAKIKEVDASCAMCHKAHKGK